MADPDYGSDLAGIDDITPDLGEVTGKRALLEALATRLIQPRGGLHYDPNYGFDTRSLLSSETKPRGVEQSIAGQIQADERVEAATNVRLTFDEATRTLEIRVDVESNEGPFTLVLEPGNASAATFEENL